MSDNKNMNNKTRIIAAAFSLATMLFSFNHCVLDQQVNTKGSGGDNTASTNTVADNPAPAPTAQPTVPPVVTTPPDIGDPTAVPPQVIQAQEIDVGIKNFEQINETMAALTGVDPMRNSIRNTYRDLETQLPTGNNLKSFLAANQVAITKLGAEYCDELVDSGTLRGNVWPGFNFGSTPNQVLSNNTQKNNLINQTLNRFWGTGLGGDRSSSQLEMLSLTNELLNGENLNSNATTRTIVKGLCTAALASAPVSMM